MNAEILTVGSEILAGDILDTNGRDIAQALTGLGILVSRRVSVSDHIDAISETVSNAVARSGVVVITGGLGPTPDDLTREGVARAVGVGLRLRHELVEPLRQRFRDFGFREMADTNLVQLTLPEGAEPIPNPIGTAPGFRIEHANSVVFSLPGIPREMRVMLEESVLPWLTAHRPVLPLAVRVLRTIGIGESDLVHRFGHVFSSFSEVEVGFYPQLPGVDLKLSSKSLAALDHAENALRAVLGHHIYGVEKEPLAKAVGTLLVAQGWHVGTAESCTGGRIAALLTSVPGSSRYFDRAVVTYSDRAKTELLGVNAELIKEHGAVSEPVARAMAEGLRERSRIEAAIAVTGIAGPDGGTPEKPVGLVWTAIAVPGETRVWRSMHGGTRDMIVTRAANVNVNRLRLMLLGEREIP
jgi:competence/damage-inducible protein CinA-like protein